MLSKVFLVLSISLITFAGSVYTTYGGSIPSPSQVFSADKIGGASFDEGDWRLRKSSAQSFQ